MVVGLKHYSRILGELLKNRGSSPYAQRVPRPVQTKGDPEELVKIQFNAPLWLKRQAVARAKAEGVAWSEWVKAAIREKLAHEPTVTKAKKG